MSTPDPSPDPLPLVPRPVLVERRTGSPFRVSADTVIVAADGDPSVAAIAEGLSALIGRAAGPDAPGIVNGFSGDGSAIVLRLGEVSLPGGEAYELTVDGRRALVQARHPAGLFYGVQTLRQLLPPFLEHEAVRFEKDRPITVPPVRVADGPRFSWRGAMLDVARHFFGVADVKRFIDLLGLHKLNRLHLHLSDDQGWRIEIASWPALARHGGSTAVGGGPGGYYTQAEYADIVAHAARRFVTIVPEIDMPGHTTAALASSAELNADGVTPPLYTAVQVGFSSLAVDREVTYRFVDDVVREISALTPGPYFHIGGDEVEALAPGQYRLFIERVQEIVRAHGKQAIGWDEIAQARLLPTTLVQHWRPAHPPAGAVSSGARVIASRADRAYLDMKYDRTTAIGLAWAGFVDVRQAWDWDPAESADGVPPSAIVGVEAPLWSETAATIRDVEMLAFPRLAAIAERGWSAAAPRDWEDFRGRLGLQAPRWSALGINYYRSREVPWAM